jgi:hypothetical protein
MVSRRSRYVIDSLSVGGSGNVSVSSKVYVGVAVIFLGTKEIVTVCVLLSLVVGVGGGVIVKVLVGVGGGVIVAVSVSVNETVSVSFSVNDGLSNLVGEVVVVTVGENVSLTVIEVEKVPGDTDNEIVGVA